MTRIETKGEGKRTTTAKQNNSKRKERVRERQQQNRITVIGQLILGGRSYSTNSFLGH